MYGSPVMLSSYARGESNVGIFFVDADLRESRLREEAREPAGACCLIGAVRTMS
jgi:hypothetical protein